MQRLQWNLPPPLVVPTGGFKNLIFILPPSPVPALFSPMPPRQRAQRHSGEENQYCVVLPSIALFCFPGSPGLGIDTMEIRGSSGNDLLPKGRNSTSVYPFCFRFDGGFALFWEVVLIFSIFQFLQRRL